MRSIEHQPIQQENAIKLGELDWRDGDERVLKAGPWQRSVDWKKCQSENRRYQATR
jgi:hypothetical protein